MSVYQGCLRVHCGLRLEPGNNRGLPVFHLFMLHFWLLTRKKKGQVRAAMKKTPRTKLFLKTPRPVCS